MALAAFLVAGLWALVAGGHWAVALLVVVLLGLQVHGAWRRDVSTGR